MTALFPLTPALERGACPNCSTDRRPTWHRGPCPFADAPAPCPLCSGPALTRSHQDPDDCPLREPRSRAVRCQDCRLRMTWNPSARCDCCKRPSLREVKS